MIKAIIADLDNTIYPVKSIADRLFAPLMDLMEEYRDEIGEETIQQVKEEITKIPFQKAADKHKLNPELKQRGINLLNHLTYDLPMQPYDDYRFMQQVNAQKFLVTMGFTHLQESKIKQLSLDKDFEEVYIVDPETTSETKQDIFKEILSTYSLQPDEVLVIGDDVESEIKAGKALGTLTYLRDERGIYPPDTATYQYPTLAHLPELFS